jgi:hypothetical protein
MVGVLGKGTTLSEGLIVGGKLRPLASKSARPATWRGALGEALSGPRRESFVVASFIRETAEGAEANLIMAAG